MNAVVIRRSHGTRAAAARYTRQGDRSWWRASSHCSRHSQLADQLRVVHDAGPIGAVALSRAATAALLLSATIKDRQQVEFRSTEMDQLAKSM